MLVELLLATAVAADTPAVRIEVDSARHRVTVVAGPFVMPAMPEMAHGGHDMRGHYTQLYRWQWPVDCWLRGIHVQLQDSTGQPLNRRLLHHITLLNFDRRQLVRPLVERLFAFGSETKDVKLPKTIGIPMSSGFQLGMYMAWNNTSEVPVSGAYLRLEFTWMPTNMMPAPTSILPLALEAKGVSGAYSVGPGVSSKSFEFTVPVGGRIVGAGGHMHDYGEYLELVDLESNSRVIHLTASTDSTGKIHGVQRILPGIYGRGIRIKSDHRYRITAVYNNTTGATLKKGAMGAIGAAFVPDDLSRWPKVDPDDADWAEDVQWMEDLKDNVVTAEQAPAQPEHHHD